VEKPPQTVTSLLSLKLKMISDRIGSSDLCEGEAQ
jgi:hypothetical protein